MLACICKGNEHVAFYAQFGGHAACAILPSLFCIFLLLICCSTNYHWYYYCSFYSYKDTYVKFT